MRAGRFADAWAICATDLKARDPATRDDPALPYHLRWVWDGRPFDGRNVLVRCYHGLGDTIQFARFLPLLAARAASVTVEAQSTLCPLLRQLPGLASVVPFDAAHPLPPSECDIEITELPFALRAVPADAPIPYLDAPAAALPRCPIGICYQAGDWDPERSIPPALFAPLAETYPTLSLVAAPTALPVLNPEGCPHDMMATAALLASVDLVLTVDTMIAHLAGAIGRPVWLLLKADPDWRWTPGAAGSGWYPTMRLYTQAEAGDWPGVLARVARDLSSVFPSSEQEVAYG